MIRKWRQRLRYDRTLRIPPQVDASRDNSLVVCADVYRGVGRGIAAWRLPAFTNAMESRRQDPTIFRLLASSSVEIPVDERSRGLEVPSAVWNSTGWEAGADLLVIDCGHRLRFMHSWHWRSYLDEAVRLSHWPEVEGHATPHGLGDAESDLLDAIAGNRAALDALSPGEFELFVAELLARRLGVVEVTAQSHDGGIDLLAYVPMPPLSAVGECGPSVVAIQCKHPAKSRRPVGVRVVRELVGVCARKRDHHEELLLGAGRTADQGIVVTSTSFTSGAQREARLSTIPIRLIDRELVFRWLDELALRRLGNSLSAGPL